jgi:hypothetical protein
MSDFILTYQSPKGDQPAPEIVFHPPSEELQPLLALTVGQIPEPYRSTRIFHALDFPPHVHHDKRLRDYRVYVYLSVAVPEDPPDATRLIIEGLDRPYTYFFWRLWIFYRHAPLVGEARYEPGLGWWQGIYQPPWVAGDAQPGDYFKVAQGLAYMQLEIRRPGRERGQKGEGVGHFDDKPTFVRHFNHALIDLRARQVDPSEERVATILGLSVRTLRRGLKDIGVRFKDVKRTGIPESVKIFSENIMAAKPVRA